MPPQVLIVGAGVTGSLLALLLREAGVAVRVLEKSRAPGGRMTTHRARAPGAARSDPILGRADLGAQYITTRTSPSHPVLGPLYETLLSAGVIAPFNGKVTGPNPYGAAGDEVRHFTAPTGMAALAEHFLAASGVTVEYGRGLKALSLNSAGQTAVQISGARKGSEGAADDVEEEILSDRCVVVLTQPVPQVLGESKHPVGGNFLSHTDPAVLEELKCVKFSSRFAAAYFFDSSSFTWPYDYTVRYFDGGAVRYAAHDTGRRGATGEQYTSILVHSGVPLGIELLDEEEPFVRAAERMAQDLATKLPEVPWAQAAAVKVHKWRYSQVYKGLGGGRPAPSPDWVWGKDPSIDSRFGYVTLFKSSSALGLLCGDSAAPAGNFEGTVFSAHKAAEAILAFLEQRSDL